MHKSEFLVSNLPLQYMAIDKMLNVQLGSRVKCVIAQSEYSVIFLLVYNLYIYRRFLIPFSIGVRQFGFILAMCCIKNKCEGYIHIQLKKQKRQLTVILNRTLFHLKHILHISTCGFETSRHHETVIVICASLKVDSFFSYVNLKNVA